jgi:hypothetical protein
MKTKMSVKLLVVISLLLVASLWLMRWPGAITAQEPPGDDISAQAAVGTTFTYQGRLMDGGNPANGTYDFEFKLYDALTGGNVITPTVGGIITRNDVPVANGLFTVNLDFGNAFDGKAAWLQIGVRQGTSTGAYTTLSPRQALNAVPYALHSLHAISPKSQEVPVTLHLYYTRASRFWKAPHILIGVSGDGRVSRFAGF